MIELNKIRPARSKAKHRTSKPEDLRQWSTFLTLVRVAVTGLFRKKKKTKGGMGGEEGDSVCVSFERRLESASQLQGSMGHKKRHSTGGGWSCCGVQ